MVPDERIADTTPSPRLARGTRIGWVHLRVPDAPRALSFYEGILGFRVAAREGNTISLSASGKGPAFLVLGEAEGAHSRPRHTTGLYHVAVRFPDRRSLAISLRRLMQAQYPLAGFADHRVSEAVYLRDPDGNGLELYCDRPAEQWLRNGKEIVMTTEPLDVEDLLAHAEGGEGSPPAETDIGHVHLQVSDLDKAEEFYSGVLGMEVTLRSYPGALFFSAGGYHHHIGVNTWAGCGIPAPPPDAVGMVEFGLAVPRHQWDEMSRRWHRHAVQQGSQEVRLVDPSGIHILLVPG